MIPVSAKNGRGVDDLLDNLVTQLPPPRTRDGVVRREPVDLAVIGKPNAGKSSVINAIVGEDRQVRRWSLCFVWAVIGHDIMLYRLNQAISLGWVVFALCWAVSALSK